MASTQEIFYRIQESLAADPNRTGGLEAVYQFNLTGEDGAAYHIVLTPNSALVSEGEAESFDCKVELAADDFKDMVEGKLTGAKAFMLGKLRVKGSIGLAMRLETVLKAYSA